MLLAETSRLPYLNPKPRLFTHLHQTSRITHPKSAAYRLTLSDSVDLFSNMNGSKAAASARLSARVTAAMLEDMMQQMRNDEHRLLKGRAP